MRPDRNEMAMKNRSGMLWNIQQEWKVTLGQYEISTSKEWKEGMKYPVGYMKYLQARNEKSHWDIWNTHKQGMKSCTGRVWNIQWDIWNIQKEGMKSHTGTVWNIHKQGMKSSTGIYNIFMSKEWKVTLGHLKYLQARNEKFHWDIWNIYKQGMKSHTGRVWNIHKQEMKSHSRTVWNIYKEGMKCRTGRVWNIHK